MGENNVYWKRSKLNKEFEKTGGKVKWMEKKKAQKQKKNAHKIKNKIYGEHV